MDGSALEKKLYFKMLGFLSLLNLIITKTAFKITEALIIHFSFSWGKIFIKPFNFNVQQHSLKQAKLF